MADIVEKANELMSQTYTFSILKNIANYRAEQLYKKAIKSFDYNQIFEISNCFFKLEEYNLECIEYFIKEYNYCLNNLDKLNLQQLELVSNKILCFYDKYQMLEEKNKAHYLIAMSLYKRDYGIDFAISNLSKIIENSTNISLFINAYQLIVQYYFRKDDFDNALIFNIKCIDYLINLTNEYKCNRNKQIEYYNYLEILNNNITINLLLLYYCIKMYDKHYGHDFRNHCYIKDLTFDSNYTYLNNCINHNHLLHKRHIKIRCKAKNEDFIDEICFKMGSKCENHYF